MPVDLAYHAASNVLFVSDQGNHRIRMIDLEGTGWPVTTIAGNGFEGDKDATGASAQFDTPAGITLGANGWLWVADTGNHQLRAIDLANKMVGTVAGGEKDEDIDGPADEAQFDSPWGIKAASNAVYVTTSTKVRKVTLP